MSVPDNQVKDVNYGKPYGIKGWALFLCLYLAIINPLLVLLRMLLIYSDHQGSNFQRIPGMFEYIMAFEIINVGIFLYSLYVGISLWRVKVNAVAKTVIFFKAMVFISAIFIVLPYMTDLSERFVSTYSTAAIIGVLKALLISVIWIMYLNRSKRIKTTFSI